MSVSAQAPSGETLEAGLRVLLAALRWRGSSRQLADAMGLRPPADIPDILDTLGRIGFVGRGRRARLASLDARLMPCLFVGQNQALIVLGEGSDAGTLSCFDLAQGNAVEIGRSAAAGTVFHFEPAGPGLASGRATGWLGRMLRPFHRQFAFLFGLSIVINGLALLPAYFVQSVYDQVLPTKADGTLQFLLAGMVLALICDFALRSVRAAALAHLGARLDFLVSGAVLAKLLAMPVALLDKTGIGGKLAQLRDGEALRLAFSSQVAVSILELPLVAMFLVALAAMTGWLALVPIVVALVAMAAGRLLLRYLRLAAERPAAVSSDHQTLLLEILGNLRAIKAGGTEALWLERYRDRSAESAALGLREARLAGLTEALAHGINISAGAATLALGATLALQGAVSVGSLIAAMTLVWRMLAPVQALFVALPRIEQMQRSGSRLDRLMQAPEDAASDPARTQTARGRRFAGRIVFDKVYFRHDSHFEPALASVSFGIKAGEIVAVTGGNGAGKSTVLKLIAALQQPQMGAVTIDGVDIRQIGAGELRQWVSYLPQRAELLDGSLRDNLRIANPVASEPELWNALARTGLIEEVEALPQGLDTEVAGQFSSNFVRRFVLARTLLVDAPIVLLDEPGDVLDAEGVDLLAEQLEALRGRATVLVATHQPEHLAIADRAIVLRHGTVVHDGAPADLVKRLAGAAS